jgi:4-hydroxythreonine-4-phosphate dehydrogenase
LATTYACRSLHQNSRSKIGIKPLLVTTGEPAGIGPDISLALANLDLPLVLMADLNMLKQRAKLLNLNVQFSEYKPEQIHIPGVLPVYHLSCKNPVKPGKLDEANGIYVIEMLEKAAKACLKNEFSGLVTAPVHKGIINKAGIAFTGHTEFFAEYCGVKTVVMMLACDVLKVALLTTHLPLSEVPKAIQHDLIIRIVSQLHTSLQKDFGLSNPKIFMAGLNPHAGENGYLGYEERDIIIPAIQELQDQGIQISGPYSADTMFTQENLKSADVFLAQYHDQGLPVLKYAGFGESVNITLGLPIIRTSVDHGTALELAGIGKASAQSLFSAVLMAQKMVINRNNYLKDTGSTP